MSSKRPIAPTPALLIQTSMRPYRASAALASRSTWLASATSVCTTSAVPPAALMRVATSSRASARRAASTTLARMPPSRSATPRPSPLEAPVTT